MVVRFSNPREVSPRGRDGLIFEFPCKIIEPNTGARKDDMRECRPRAKISRTQLGTWESDISFEGENHDLIADTLFEYIRKSVYEAIAREESPDEIEVILNDTTAENEYPFEVNDLMDPDGFEVEFDLIELKERYASDQGSEKEFGFNIPEEDE
jgi:hypothetical protein